MMGWRCAAGLKGYGHVPRCCTHFGRGDDMQLMSYAESYAFVEANQVHEALGLSEYADRGA